LLLFVADHSSLGHVLLLVAFDSQKCESRTKVARGEMGQRALGLNSDIWVGLTLR